MLVQCHVCLLTVGLAVALGRVMAVLIPVMMAKNVTVHVATELVLSNTSLWQREDYTKPMPGKIWRGIEEREKQRERGKKTFHLSP